MNKNALSPVALAVVMGLASSPSVFAEQANSDTTSSASAPVPSDIERITIRGQYTTSERIDTATGLGLAIDETPQSVSVMTAQRIKDQDLESINDVVLQTVGLSSNDIDNVRNGFYARGFEIDNYQIDGVPLSWSLAGDSGETIADVSMYERVEVVRGATGLLTGVGDPSASINLVRKHADSTQLEGSINAGVGSWDRREVTLDVANKLNQDGSIRGRLVAKYDSGHSFQEQYEDNNQVFYATTDIDLTTADLLRLGASYQHQDPHAPLWGAMPTFYSDGSKTDWSRSKTSSANWARWETTQKNYFANYLHTFGNGWQLKVDYNRLEYKQRSKLIYFSGNVERDTGALPINSLYRSRGHSQQDSFDIQLDGDYALFGRQHDFVVGALYSSQDAQTVSYDPVDEQGNVIDPYTTPINVNFYDWDGHYPEPNWADTSSPAEDLTTRQKGLYAATRLSFTDDLKVILGGRVSSWKRNGISYQVTENYGDSDKFIPYAGVLYDVTEQHRLYASYTEIFTPQNYRDRSYNQLDPLEGENYELGLKSRFFDDMLHTTAAVFYVKQDNLAQIDGAQITHAGNLFQPYRAAQGTESKGFEIEVVGQPTDAWNINVGYTQFHADDADGNRVNTYVPDRQFKLFTTYDFAGVLDGLTLGGGYRWQDKTYSAGANPVTGVNTRLTQGAYGLLDLMARYEVNDRLSLQANFKNVLDKKYYSQVSFLSQYHYGDPSNFMLNVEYKL